MQCLGRCLVKASLTTLSEPDADLFVFYFTMSGLLQTKFPLLKFYYRDSFKSCENNELDESYITNKYTLVLIVYLIYGSWFHLIFFKKIYIYICKPSIKNSVIFDFIFAVLTIGIEAKQDLMSK